MMVFAIHQHESATESFSEEEMLGNAKSSLDFTGFHVLTSSFYKMGWKTHQFSLLIRGMLRAGK